METVNPKIPSTIEAAALCKMADRGQITGGILDGPLALDNAISAESAAIKKIVSPVAGRANVLIVPDLESGQHAGQEPVLPGRRRCGRHRARRQGADHPDQPRRLGDGAPRVLRRGARWSPRRGARTPPRRSAWSDAMTDAILVLNAGSSSIKFSVFAATPAASSRSCRADRSRASAPRRASRARTPPAKPVGEQRWEAGATLGHDGALAHDRRVAAAHARRRPSPGRGRPPRRPRRHGLLAPGPRRRRGDRGAREAGAARAAAPAAQPRADPGACSSARPSCRRSPASTPRFTATIPRVAQMFALPSGADEAGVRRYGFHGLSYEYIAVACCRSSTRAAARGKTVVLHLGNGASMCALAAGRSIASTMGFTGARRPADGHALAARSIPACCST